MPHEIEVINAIIRKTSLGTEDHGILTCYIHLDYSGAIQTLGGWTFDTPISVNGRFSHREGTAFGMEFINRILKTLRVDTWEKLPGTPVRVKKSFREVHAIGHFIEDRWFDPRNDLTHLFND
jgi:hypothetical protein